ncbi:MAG: hypothetical protein KBD29_02875 [Candidatus Magasanikbacteria bacterium]|nr:hypothetical protein [Candidatus Magasanikbacteria bacterium]
MMFPVRINVLSDSKKNHLKRLALFTYLKSSFALVFSLIAVLAAVLLVTESFFIDYRAALTYGVLSGRRSYLIDTQRIAATNSQLKKIEQTQSTFTLWSPRLHTILAALPPGIEVSSIILDGETHTFSLAGVASSREVLGLCETAMKALPILESVQIPLGELTRKEDIPFTIQATLK